MCIGPYFLLIQPNAAKLTERHFTVEMDDDPKHTVKATQDLNAKKWDIHQWPSQSDLISKEQAFQLLLTKLKQQQ